MGLIAWQPSVSTITGACSSGLNYVNELYFPPHDFTTQSYPTKGARCPLGLEFAQQADKAVQHRRWLTKVNPPLMIDRRRYDIRDSRRSIPMHPTPLYQSTVCNRSRGSGGRAWLEPAKAYEKPKRLSLSQDPGV